MDILYNSTQLQYLRSLPSAIQLITAALIFSITYYILTREKAYPGIPIARLPKESWKAYLVPEKFSFITNPAAVLAKGKEISNNNCFQVRAAAGWKIIVPNRFAEELRNRPELTVAEFGQKDFLTHYSGFDGIRQGFRSDNLMADVVRIKLTQSVGLLTDVVVKEADESIRDHLGESPEWETYLLKDKILDVISRISSTIFLGKELAQNREWLHLAKQNAIDTFIAAYTLHMIPGILRPVLQWVLPGNRNIRKHLRNARRIIEPEVKKRLQAAEEAERKGEKLPKSMDAFSWMMEVAKGRKIDFVGGQMFLSLAAFHTTTEATARALVQLCETPEIVGPLREEMVRVLREDGWAKTTLYKMKLLDSFLKEVQRTNQAVMTNMMRYVKSTTELSDGTVLPAGAMIMIDDGAVRDAEIYEDPEKFDAHRYLRKRERAGEENRHQFVTTSPDNLAFGHGQHACPGRWRLPRFRHELTCAGRFFASTEMKVLFCFILLRYDLRYVPGADPPKYTRFEHHVAAPPDLKVQFRRRKEEIDLLDPKDS